MTSIVKNLPEVLNGLNLMIRRTEETYLDAYREAVWEIFCRILENTPQYTGRAVANWRIGLGAPDTSYEEVGDAAEVVHRESRSGAHVYSTAATHQRGDGEWIEYAKFHNAHKLKEMQRFTRVFISNNTKGDTDGGKSSALYLESLQNPTYWVQKLRRVNQPYEIAQESVIAMQQRFLTGGTSPIQVRGLGWRKYT